MVGVCTLGRWKWSKMMGTHCADQVCACVKDKIMRMRLVEIQLIEASSEDFTLYYIYECNSEFSLSLPSQEILEACSPIRSKDLLSSKPSFSRWIPSLVILLCPKFSVSRLCVEPCMKTNHFALERMVLGHIQC